MKTHLRILLLFIFLHTTTTSSTQNGATAGISIRELLHLNGLPAGLFPREVRSYRVDNNGLLEVRLDQPCLARFEEEVRFETVVKANLSYGGLIGVQGMSQQELFLWFNVRDIVVNDPNSGIILFNIGVAQKQLSISLFEDPPACKPQQQKQLLGNTLWKPRGWKQLMMMENPKMQNSGSE